uniref:Uncharacterized protein n=1 Tax=Timema monikensis TaxID=170555 RepID=A0A7R9HR58_9NEOP|nr:unnamed protein product [Timema monikensis]
MNPSSPDQDSNLDRPVLGSLITQHETSALANYATGAAGRGGASSQRALYSWGLSTKWRRSSHAGPRAILFPYKLERTPTSVGSEGEGTMTTTTTTTVISAPVVHKSSSVTVWEIKDGVKTVKYTRYQVVRILAGGCVLYKTLLLEVCSLQFYHSCFASVNLNMLLAPVRRRREYILGDRHAPVRRGGEVAERFIRGTEKSWELSSSPRRMIFVSGFVPRPGNCGGSSGGAARAHGAVSAIFVSKGEGMEGGGTVDAIRRGRDEKNCEEDRYGGRQDVDDGTAVIRWTELEVCSLDGSGTTPGVSSSVRFQNLSALLANNLVPVVCLSALRAGNLVPVVCLSALRTGNLVPVVCLSALRADNLVPVVCLSALRAGNLVPVVCLSALRAGNLVPVVCLSALRAGNLVPVVCLSALRAGNLVPVVCLSALRTDNLVPVVCLSALRTDNLVPVVSLSALLLAGNLPWLLAWYWSLFSERRLNRNSLT